MSIARGEQETIIRRDVDGLWHVWSDVPSDIDDFMRRGARLVKRDSWGGVSFEMPEKEWAFRPVPKRKPLTEEQRQRSIATLQRGRKKKDEGQAS